MAGESPSQHELRMGVAPERSDQRPQYRPLMARCLYKLSVSTATSLTSPVTSHLPNSFTMRVVFLAFIVALVGVVASSPTQEARCCVCGFDKPTGPGNCCLCQ